MVGDAVRGQRALVDIRLIVLMVPIVLSHMHPELDNETVLMIFDGEGWNKKKPVLEPPSCKHDDVLLEQALAKMELQRGLIDSLIKDKTVLKKKAKIAL